LNRRLVAACLLAVGLTTILIWSGRDRQTFEDGSGTEPRRVSRAQESGGQDEATSSSSYNFAGEWTVDENPFGIGDQVTPQEAQARTAYDLPTPVTNETTGELVATWLAPGDRVAFVWDTELIMYAQRDQASEAENTSAWTQKVAEQAGEPWILTEIQGHPAIGMDKDGKVAPELSDGRGEEIRILGSSLTVSLGDVLIQFNSPQHSLDQLIGLAEQIEAESASD
jgi:hypothetical protein